MKKIKIDTYNDLIEIIKKYKLEDKKINVGCEGYLSNGEDTYIIINRNYIAITDPCGSYDEKLEEESE